MRKSLIWFNLFLLITGCRLLPSKTATPVPMITEEVLFTPGTSDGTPPVEITPIQILTPTMLPVITETTSPISTSTATPIIISTATRLPFILQSVSPVYIKNFGYPDKGCNWMGVAGQVFDTNGNPIKNIVVVIKGQLGEKTINSVVLTGLKEANIYGPGGYEIVLNDNVIGSIKSLSIHLDNLNGNILSSEIEFDTFTDCNKNLIIINFQLIK